MKLWGIFLFLLFLTLPAYTQDTVAALQNAQQFYFNNQPDKALQTYLELSKQTQDRQAFLNAAFIALEQGKTHQAVDIMMAAYRYYPTDEEVVDMLTEVLLADGQYSAAERIIGLSSLLEKHMGLYSIQLARAQLGMQNWDLAKHNLTQATPDPLYRPLAYYLLGTLYTQENNFEKAIDAYTKTLEQDHQFTEARRALANALEKANRLEDAWQQYTILAAIDKNEPNTKNALARLRPQISPIHKEKSSQTIISHTFVSPLPVTDTHILRVGLGVQINGKPSSIGTVAFSPSHPFDVFNEKNIKIASGREKEIWKIVLNKNQASLIGPTGKTYPFKHKITVVPFSNDATKEPTFILKNVVSGSGMTWMSVGDKEYRGKLEVIHNTHLHTLVPVNIVSLEAYLQGVIAAEMPTNFPQEALKAQAVLARTYALKHNHKHHAYGYDVCDSQNCQVYGGVQAETERGNEAVTSTHGHILRYREKPIEGVFSANTGGITQSSKDAGWEETPYLQSVADYKIPLQLPPQPYQFKTLLQTPPPAYGYYDKNVSLSAFRWMRVVSIEDVQQVIKRKKKDIGTITNVLVAQRNSSGYVTKLLVKGTKGSVALAKENLIRTHVSIGMLRSSYFMVVPQYTQKKLTHFIFYGGGWGHGVGFDQTGAAGRAEDGETFSEILQHYFPLVQLYSGL